jgi:hypothetical protein
LGADVVAGVEDGVVERKRALAGTERTESGKTEFLDVVWNRREAWRQGDFVLR